MKIKKASERGQALVLVCGVAAVALLVVVGLFSVVRGRTDDLRVDLDRMKGQYLCETAASVAIVDIKTGTVGNGPGQWTSRTFPFTVGSKTYSLSYDVSKDAGQWIIKGIATSPGGLGMTYTLVLGGQRAVPFFLLGIPVYWMQGGTL